MDPHEWEDPRQRRCDLEAKSLWLIARCRLLAEMHRAAVDFAHALGSRTADAEAPPGNCPQLGLMAHADPHRDLSDQRAFTGQNFLRMGLAPPAQSKR